MFKRIFLSLAVAALPASGFAAGAPRATPAEAQAMLKAAVDYYNTHSRDEAIAAFNRNKPPFSDRELYVFCLGPDNTIVADGGYPQFVNQSADLMRDSEGNTVGRQGWEEAMKTGHAEVHYRWFNPETQLIEPKVSYFAKLGTDACAVGAYEAK